MLSFVISSSRAAQDSKESQETQEAKKGTCLCWSEKHYGKNIECPLLLRHIYLKYTLHLTSQQVLTRLHKFGRELHQICRLGQQARLFVLLSRR